MDYGKTKKSTLRLDKIDSWKLDDLTCLTIIRKNENTVGGSGLKKSRFADFVIFRPYTYARTRQFLSPLWTAIRKRKGYIAIQIP